MSNVGLNDEQIESNVDRLFSKVGDLLKDQLLRKKIRDRIVNLAKEQEGLNMNWMFVFIFSSVLSEKLGAIPPQKEDEA